MFVCFLNFLHQFWTSWTVCAGARGWRPRRGRRSTFCARRTRSCATSRPRGRRCPTWPSPWRKPTATRLRYATPQTELKKENKQNKWITIAVSIGFRSNLQYPENLETKTKIIDIRFNPTRFRTGNLPRLALFQIMPRWQNGMIDQPCGHHATRGVTQLTRMTCRPVFDWLGRIQWLIGQTPAKKPTVESSWNGRETR